MHPLLYVLPWVIAAFWLSGCSAPPPTPREFDPDAVPDAFLHPTAALVHPLATRSMLVTPGGHLFNGVWWTRIEASVNGQAAPAPGTIASEDRWLPVVRWSRQQGPVRFDFEAVALPEPEPLAAPVARAAARQMADWIDVRARREHEAVVRAFGEDRVDGLVLRSARQQAAGVRGQRNLLVSLEVRVRHQGLDPCATRLALTFDRPEEAPPFVAADGGQAPSTLAWRSASAPLGSSPHDSVLGWAYLQARRARAETAWVLAPGESRTLRFVLSAYPIAASDLERWARVSHDERVHEARNYWISEIERGARIEVGDPELENAVRAARVVLLSCREQRDGRWVPIGGPFHYRDVYLRDGARALQALTLHGYVREARELARAFEEWQWPHGPFVSQTAQLDGTGQALWTFEQVFLRPAPDPEVGRYARAAARAVAWFERQRARGTNDPVAAASSPSHLHIGADGAIAGLMPFADPRDNELVRGQLVGTDAWAIAGYRAAARLLRAAGQPEAARDVAVDLARYQQRFATALEGLGHADLPASWSGTGLDWGNLAVGFPCQALPASDPRLAALASRYWSRGGGPGFGYYGTPVLRHGYVAADLGAWALMVGRRDEAEAVLAELLHWRNASGTGAELFTRDGDFGFNVPPHPTSAAALLTLTRNALVFDDTDHLILTAGARATWWRHGRARDLPTRWGMLDLEFRQHQGRAEWRWTPVPVWTELTLPPGTIVAGDLPWPLERGGRADIVRVPPGIGRAQIAIRDVAAAGFAALFVPSHEPDFSAAAANLGDRPQDLGSGAPDTP